MPLIEIAKHQEYFYKHRDYSVFLTRKYLFSVKIACRFTSIVNLIEIIDNRMNK